MTPADLAAPVVATFTCASPDLMKLEGGALRPIGKLPTVQLASDARGPFVVYDSLVFGKKVLRNHWATDDGDHFFMLSSDHSYGSEIFIPKNRLAALDVTYAALQDDTVSLVITSHEHVETTNAAGRIQPTSPPWNVGVCVKDGPGALPLTDATPMSAVPPTPNQFRILGCTPSGEKGSREEIAAREKLPFVRGVGYEWMPTELYQDGTNWTVVFGTTKRGPRSVFAVPGQKTFRIGGGTYTIVAGKQQRLVIGLRSGDDALYTCSYGS